MDENRRDDVIAPHSFVTGLLPLVLEDSNDLE